MDSPVGTKGLVWGSIGAELLEVFYDLRYMVLCSIFLILADLWWGYRENKKRLEYAESIKNETLKDKFKWHKSRAMRRSANKCVDYLTYLICGALVGLAITEPTNVCSHVWTAAIGLGVGCACDISSIVGHIVYVRMGMEISVADAFRAVMKFIGKLIKVKSSEFGEAVESLGKEKDKTDGDGDACP